MTEFPEEFDWLTPSQISQLALRLGPNESFVAPKLFITGILDRTACVTVADRQVPMQQVQLSDGRRCFVRADSANIGDLYSPVPERVVYAMCGGGSFKPIPIYDVMISHAGN